MWCLIRFIFWCALWVWGGCGGGGGGRGTGEGGKPVAWLVAWESLEFLTTGKRPDSPTRSSKSESTIPCLPPLLAPRQLLDLEAHAIRADLLRTAVDRTTIMQNEVNSYLRGAVDFAQYFPTNLCAPLVLPCPALETLSKAVPIASLPQPLRLYVRVCVCFCLCLCALCACALLGHCPPPSLVPQPRTHRHLANHQSKSSWPCR